MRASVGLVTGLLAVVAETLRRRAHLCIFVSRIATWTYGHILHGLATQMPLLEIPARRIYLAIASLRRKPPVSASDVAYRRSGRRFRT